MKATGIVRRVDELGRIVIPKEIRTAMKIKEGEPMELYVDKNGIILQKYTDTNSAADWAAGILKEHLRNVLTVTVVQDETVVVMRSGVVSKAKRDPKDPFDYNVGVAVYIARALKIEIPSFI